MNCFPIVVTTLKCDLLVLKQAIVKPCVVYRKIGVFLQGIQLKYK